MPVQVEVRDFLHWLLNHSRSLRRASLALLALGGRLTGADPIVCSGIQRYAATDSRASPTADTHRSQRPIVPVLIGYSVDYSSFLLPCGRTLPLFRTKFRYL